MSDAFQIITKDEYESLGASSYQSSVPAYDDAPKTVWCEFCKGYYIEENHVTFPPIRDVSAGGDPLASKTPPAPIHIEGG